MGQGLDQPLTERLEAGGIGGRQEKQIDVPKARSRKKTARDRAMKKAIPMANERYKKKNGQFRANRSQADVMRLANKLADKMMK